MQFEVDQSGKVEQTERHTVVACVNSKKVSILIKKSEKRSLQKVFRQTSNQRYFPYLTFAALLAILLKKVNPKIKVVVDREYVGHEHFILEKRIGLEPLNSGMITWRSAEIPI